MALVPRTRPLVLLVLLGLAGLAPVSASAQTKGQVDSAEDARDAAYQELVQADAELTAALEELEAINGELYRLNWRIDQLRTRIGEYEGEVTGLEESARALVVEAYINGGRDLITAAFAAGSIQDLLTSQVLIDRATSRDLIALDRLSAVNREMDRLRIELDAKEDEVAVLQQLQAEVVAELDELQRKASDVFAKADAKYHDLVARYKARLAAEAARRAALATGAAAGVPASVTKGVTCPVAGGASFIDSWGYPRSGGRTHKGTDMFRGMGSTLVAMYSGSVRTGWHSLGGNQIYLYGDNGLFYYYAHLQSITVQSGQRVDKGQAIGTMGDTGNARGTPHLHLGMGPIGSSLVNPYPTVRGVC
jgi:murein DD-endopeptidase MepM/ murein hydrolase activator NlpD